MVISSSPVSLYVGTAYHRREEQLRTFLILIDGKEKVEEIREDYPTEPRLETQQGCPLNVQGL